MMLKHLKVPLYWTESRYVESQRSNSKKAFIKKDKL